MNHTKPRYAVSENNRHCNFEQSIARQSNKADSFCWTPDSTQVFSVMPCLKGLATEGATSFD